MASEPAPPSPYKALLKHARTKQIRRTATRRATKAAAAAAAASSSSSSTASETAAASTLGPRSLIAAVALGVAATVAGVVVWRRLRDRQDGTPARKKEK